MAKKVYKIPHSLAEGWLDVEIAITGDNGVGLHPIALKNILVILGSAIGLLWAVMNTGVKDAGVGLILLFIVAWIALSVLLLRPDKMGGMTMRRVPALLEYIPKSSRYVKTRSNQSASPFYSIANIDHIDEERGLVYFADGWLGFVYRVVGSGSVLLFEEDRDAIIDRVDAFYRHMKTDYEYIFITTRESQNVRLQLQGMDRRIAYLKQQSDTSELVSLLETKRDWLARRVGSQFKSIHQYMILRAPTQEALTLGRNMLQSEVENSSLCFKRCSAVFDDELHEVFAKIFKSSEDS